MLKEQIPHEGGRPEKPLHDVIVSKPTLAELGISPIQSHRWQLEAEIPEEKFEQYIAEKKASADGRYIAYFKRLRCHIKI